MIKLFHFFKIARKMPLLLLLTRTLRKLGVENSWTKRIDFLNSGDVKRPDKAIKILFDCLHNAKISPQSLARHISGSVVLEVGCGRHIGLAPFLLGLGARRYIGIDPSLDGKLLELNIVKERYLSLALDSARVFAASQPGFNSMPFLLSGLEGAKETLARCRLERNGMGQLLGNAETADICVSISCFEHINDFSAAARALAEFSHSQTIHLHIVNFSNHLSKTKPFHGLYEMPYEKFGKTWSHNVNGLRVSDMIRELDKTGLCLRAIPLDSKPDSLPDCIDDSWLGSYPLEELAIRTALLTSL